MLYVLIFQVQAELYVDVMNDLQEEMRKMNMLVVSQGCLQIHRNRPTPSLKAQSLLREAESRGSSFRRQDTRRKKAYIESYQ